MKQLAIAALLAAGFTVALAKLPPPDPAAKDKADQEASKAAWQAKVDAYQLCKVQDRIAAAYRKSAKGDAKPAAAMPVAANAASSPASVSPSAAASSGAATPTPAVASAPTPCAEPGPYTYNPPSQTPLETSGAHSPAGNAVSPPSVIQDSGQMQSGKK